MTNLPITHRSWQHCRADLALSSMAKKTALPIDHLVINVHRDLSLARGLFERLGFTLTPMGRHTMGSINHLMVFGDDYIEAIGLPADGAVERSELLNGPVGMDGLVFKTPDAEQTHARLAAAGEPLLPVQSFSRPVQLGDRVTDARFKTVRFEANRFPAGRVYFCQHDTPELVWRKEWQSHACQAMGIAALLIVSTQPQVDARHYAAIAGGTTRRGAHGEFRIDGAQYSLVVVTPQDYRACFGALAVEAHGRPSFFGAIALRVKSLAPLRSILEALESEPVSAADLRSQRRPSPLHAEYVFRDRGDRIAVSMQSVGTLLEFIEKQVNP